MDVVLIEKLLKRARGKRVTLTTSDTLLSGVTLLNAESFDAVLLDLGLPDSAGLEALQRVQECKPMVPVVVLTGYENEEAATGALHLGAQDYLFKGQIDTNVLFRSIRYAIERQRGQTELKASEERFKRAIRDSAFPAMIHAEGGQVLQINRIWEEITGYELQDIQTIELWAEKAFGENREQVKKHIEGLYSIASMTEEGEYCIKTKNGETRIWVFSSTPVGSLSDGRRLIMSMAVDITERKQMEETIRHQATHDPLTRLPNKLLFVDLLRLEMTEARRNKRKLAVLFLDLDRFKEINDTLGHDTGDHLLIEVAARIKECVRDSDTVSRIGGDEFNILVSDIIRSEDVSKVPRKILAGLQKPFVISNNALHVTASIGISMYPDDSLEVEGLLKYADIAMYHAKELGKNNYQFYNHAINTRTLERVKLENNLRRALEREELVLYYQPQVDAVTRSVICTEALLRWHHPKLGLLYPSQFLSLAEHTGLIVPIGEWVLKTACRQNKAWQEAGHPSICVTVNLSFLELRHPGLVKMASSKLKESRLDPQCLDFEITENTAMHDIELTTSAMRGLAELGVNLSLDDFGTGYSSLTHIKKLPIQRIKIDRSFISDLATNPDDVAIVKAVIGLAHNLRLKVVAEGVETEEQLLFLQSHECDVVQGYLTGEPLPADQLERMLV